MSSIFVQAISFFLVIFIAYFLKRTGLVSKADGEMLSIIITRVTLPAAIIQGMSGVGVSRLFLGLMGIGIFVNIFLTVVGGLWWKKKEPLQQGLMMYSISGYNIGNFALAFIHGFFPIGVPFICMFDMGNSFMIAGGTNVLVDVLSGRSASLKEVKTSLLTMLKSFAILTYLLMFVLGIFHLKLPQPVLDGIALPANANGFISMFMIGLYMDFRLPKKAAKDIVKVLGYRYAAAFMMATLLFLCPFLAEEVRLVLVMLTLSPIPIFAVINGVKFGLAKESMGFLTSISILISLILMTSAMLLLH